MAMRTVQQKKKQKFAGGLTFLGVFLATACIIYLPWETYITVSPTPVEESAAPAPAAAPEANTVAGRLAYERYGKPTAEQPTGPTWYNDKYVLVQTAAANRQALANSTYTIVVLIGIVLPFSIFFFIK